MWPAYSGVDCSAFGQCSAVIGYCQKYLLGKLLIGYFEGYLAEGIVLTLLYFDPKYD
jgi:hypothetical protein